MEERFRFLEDWRKEEWSFAELCRRYEVSRKTGYKWLERYQEGGLVALSDRPRAPQHHPNQVIVEVEEAVLEARADHPHWGPSKLHAWLARRAPEIVWPAPSTIGELLRRHGLTAPRKRVRKASPSAQPLAHADGPNAVWSADFKGWFRCGDQSRCYPLTISDAASRYLIRCQALSQPDEAHARPLFEAAFREYGLPERMRTDNGPPFATVGVGGLSRLSVWWIKLGIHPERIEPGQPAQNGRHERMHRTLKAETARPPAATMRAQQRVFDQFREEYNRERPHEALQQRTPAQCYRPSLRAYPSRLEPTEYPSEWERRAVRLGGSIKWRGQSLFVSKALTGELIGLEPLVDGLWRLWFDFYEFGELDERKMATNSVLQAGNFRRSQGPKGAEGGDR